ncbi:MAG: helix-turn-helix transcriptional regulator [Luteolibacter sp.]
MSWTSEWLKDWLSAGKTRRTQVELAALAGVDPANISRYLSGQTRPESDVIERILSKLSQEDGARLVTAWLTDSLPSSARQLVQIFPNTTSKVSDQTDDLFLYGIGRDLRERLEFFGRLAMVNPDVRKILDVCYDAARRKQDKEA